MNYSVFIKCFCLSDDNLRQFSSLVFSTRENAWSIIRLIIRQILCWSISSLLIRWHSVRILTDIFQYVLSFFEFVFPSSNIVIWVFVLKSFQNVLILKCNSKQLIFTTSFVQTFLLIRNCLRSCNCYLICKSCRGSVWILHDWSHFL